MKVALDVESVLADTNAAFFALYNEKYGTNYSEGDQTDWEWVERELEPGAFVEITHEMWANHRDLIQPRELDLPETVARLYAMCETLDIVTARPHREEEMREWLADHGITAFDSAFSTERSCKSGYGYDVYIDDKPDLCENLRDTQIQMMVTHTFNDDVRDLRAVHVDTVAEAVDWVEQHYTPGSLYVPDARPVRELPSQEWMKRDVEENKEMYEALADGGDE